MPGKPHVHIVTGKTCSDLEHLHFFSGFTAPAQTDDPAHTHRLRISAAAHHGHGHILDVETEPGVRTGAGHVHPVRGLTGAGGEGPHAHRFDDLTGPSLTVG